MSAAQMKFIEEQRKKNKPSISALGTTAPSKPAAAPVSAAPAPGPTTSTNPLPPQETIEVAPPKKKTIIDMWRVTEGSGTLGTYTVCRHTDSGLILEMWHEGAGSFSFRRATGGWIKYCSSYGSLQEEPTLQAPRCAELLDEGKGSEFRPGSTSAGTWGVVELRGKRLVFKCTVKTRNGSETIELFLTREGMVFLPAEGFKAVAVRNGEFMPLSKSEAMNMLKGMDADPDGMILGRS